jgi:hypothetical protein
MLLPSKLATAMKFSAIKLPVLKTALALGLSAVVLASAGGLLRPSLSLHGDELQGLALASAHGASDQIALRAPILETEKQAYLNNMCQGQFILEFRNECNVVDLGQQESRCNFGVCCQR